MIAGFMDSFFNIQVLRYAFAFSWASASAVPWTAPVDRSDHAHPRSPRHRRRLRRSWPPAPARGARAAGRRRYPFAAHIPDIDYLALVRGRETMERFHQGPLHSIGFVAVAAAALALLLRRPLGFSRAWPLIAGAGLTHLLLDLMVVDLKPPIGLPFLWP